MSGDTDAQKADLLSRFTAFVVDRFPFLLPAVRRALGALDESAVDSPEAIERLGAGLLHALHQDLASLDGTAVPDPSPRVTAAARLEAARVEAIDACEGFFVREAIAASFTADERRELLRGMVLTRALDNRLKALFTSGEVRFRNLPFQGKGFRSLGQEAIYAVPLRLRRGAAHRTPAGWQGDVIGPVIRDVGAALAMRPEAETVRMVLNAQMGKAGAPMDGKDLHIGDMEWGILPPAAPLAISSLTIAGVAMAMAREGLGRVAVSFIGEGGSSLGEWHEAINACAARRLPAVFCVEHNQIALSTPAAAQSAARTFADKAGGYGIPGITIDGTDPEAIAAAFAWAADRARAGRGPALIELVSMRMCGHAHHDDMLYLGREPRAGWEYAQPAEGAYVDRELYAYWSARDPIAGYAARLQSSGIIAPGDLERYRRDAEALVEQQAQAVIEAPWPEPGIAGAGVVAGERPRVRLDPLEPGRRPSWTRTARLPDLEPGLPFDASGQTLLEAIALAIGEALRSDPRVFVFGQDVGAPYGNAFLMLRPLLEEFGGRIVDSPLAEGAVLGVCVGAALAGARPIAEIQFNDFVATGFNQLINNAAKIRYRWGGSVPMVVRLPWGGLRHAGPYHSQNTEAWFYRTPGLKIVAPSTPQDARALLAAAIADPDPVLFYEHIALYRDPRVKQRLPAGPPDPLPIGKAALRREGGDLAIVSYGAYVHRAMDVAERLAAGGIHAAVLDLRSLAPLDRDALLDVTRACSRVLIVHEDARTGSIGESLAAIIQEDAFEWLDAPVRIVGGLDTPVPYSPPLEEFFLPSQEEIERAARLLVEY